MPCMHDDCIACMEMALQRLMSASMKLRLGLDLCEIQKQGDEVSRKNDVQGIFSSLHQ